MSSHPDSAISFGRYTLLPRLRRVLRDGVPVRLGARAVDLLGALAARSGDVVAKDELIESVWPGLVVEENNLHVQVSALRKLLGRDAIVTVAGRGYSLDAAFGGQVPPIGDSDFESGPSREVLPPLRGRSVEVATLRRLLRERRIVTIVGPGGVGKSRLVHEALAAEHGISVTHIELGEGAAAPALADAEAAGGAEGAVLLVENAEQSLECTGEFADRLANLPGIRMVCTSQAPLKARGEHVLRLAPLAVPHTDGGSAGDMTPALEMMVDAVRTMEPEFELDEEGRRDAAAICRHLDGLPLAISLAAGRVPLLGIAAVRRRLVNRFRLLSGAARGTPPRHQSLLASMEWSWGLLAPRERAALAALSKLPGRFTLLAATGGLADIAGDEWAAMQLVGALVDKSVVLADGHSAFRLPESMRLFAQLRAAG